MLYSVAVMSASKRKTLVRTNSFSLARKAYLSALSNESYETCYSHASMTCAGRPININKLSDQITTSQVRSS